jgi:hypothetical protein
MQDDSLLGPILRISSILRQALESCQGRFVSALSVVVGPFAQLRHELGHFELGASDWQSRRG